MNKLLETIKIINGKGQFLEYHNARLNYARRVLFNAQNYIDLQNIIQAPSQNGIYKSRIVYSNTIENIEYSPYQDKNRDFKTFKVIPDNNIIYNFKYLNRTDLNRLVALKNADTDDIIIVKNGFVTDSSIANLAFWSHNKWITPLKPLLKGTMRERLLRENKIVEAVITLEDLKKFSNMAMMNALLGFYIIENFQLIF
jgi:4-amino-4-deoxychorismate lyase